MNKHIYNRTGESRFLTFNDADLNDTLRFEIERARGAIKPGNTAVIFFDLLFKSYITVLKAGRTVEETDLGKHNQLGQMVAIVWGAQHRDDLLKSWTARITPPEIPERPVPGCVLVFPSNWAGRHGAGLAKFAADHWGARYGKGIGFDGYTYALATKDQHIKTLPIEVIARTVDEFLEVAAQLPHLVFLVTKIGCGLAGYTPEQMAPLFEKAVGLPNVWLPMEFWAVLNPKIMAEMTAHVQK